MTGLRARLAVPGRLNVEVSVEPGEVVAVIGPNGAGKSTLLAALAGLLPAEGEVVVDGESWTEPPRSVQDRKVRDASRTRAATRMRRGCGIASTRSSACAASWSG